MTDTPDDAPPDYITIHDAAKELGITTRRVRTLCEAGRLKARKLGRDWLILPADLDAVRVRPTGRPPWHDIWAAANPERAKAYEAEKRAKERRKAKRLREEAREAAKQPKARQRGKERKDTKE